MAEQYNWTKFVKKYAEANNITYHQALKVAGEEWAKYKMDNDIQPAARKKPTAKSVEEVKSPEGKVTATSTKPRAKRQTKAQKQQIQQQAEIEKLRLEAENLRLKAKLNLETESEEEEVEVVKPKRRTKKVVYVSDSE